MDVRDQVYCFELARRAVGRAAIHLGIESMTEESLNVMADVLLSYLNRVGKTLAHLVEASGRTSSHVNILDTFQAVQVVTSPAVHRLHLMDHTDGDAINQDLFGGAASSAVAAAQSGGASSVVAAATNTDGGNSAAISNGSMLGGASMANPGWQSLAAFCFGPNWHEKSNLREGGVDIDGNGDLTGMRGPGGGAGGKRGPSAISDQRDGGGAGPGFINKHGGWDAPYLDEVPQFPQASPTCANPHPLPSHVGLSLHGSCIQDEDDESTRDGDIGARTEQLVHAADHDLASIPYGAFSWGSLQQQQLNKRKYSDLNETRHMPVGGMGEDASMAIDSTTTGSTSSPPSKKLKMDDGAPSMQSTSSGAGGSDKILGKGGGDKKKATPNEKKKDGTAVGGNKGGAKNRKKKSNADDEDLDDAAMAMAGQQLRKKQPRHNLPYVPNFYPPAPIARLSTTGRKVVDSTSATTKDPAHDKAESDASGVTIAAHIKTRTDDNEVGTSAHLNTDIAQDVRSSLVELGHYWGSGWEARRASTTTRESAVVSASDLAVRVPLGRVDTGGIENSATIVPVPRASGSRVSRILEGSMDAAAMQ